MLLSPVRLSMGVALVLALFLATACSKSKETLLASGDAYAAAGKHREAVLEYGRAVALDPKFGDARYRLAKSYLALNDLPRASVEFIAAADLLLTNMDAQEKALRFLVLSGRFEDALTSADRVLQQNPENVDAHLAKATALAGLKKVDDAVVEALLAVRISKQEARALVVAGDLLWRQKNLREAEASYRQAVEVDPKAVEPMLALGTFYWVTGRATDAEPLLRRAAAAAPSRMDTQTRLVDFLAANGRVAEAEEPLKALAASSGSGESRLALADYYLNTGRFEDARPLLEKLVSEPGGFAPAKVRLIRLDHQLGRKTEALRSVAELLEKEPKNSDGLALKAGFLLEDGKVDDALAAAKAAVVADPRSATAQTALGDVYNRRNDAEGALGAFTEAMTLNPQSATVKGKVARLQFEKGAFQVALQLATEAVGQDPRNLEAHRTRVQALSATGNRKLALQTLKAMVAANPGFAELHTDLGRVFLAQKDYAAAVQEFDRALELAPTSLEALRGKVAVDILNGRKDKARTTVEQRLQASPSNKGLVMLAVDTYTALGDTARLEPALNRLLEVDPNNIDAYGGLARIYLAQGKLDEAKAKFLEVASQGGGPAAVAASTMAAMILDTQNKGAEARQAYEKIVAKNPEAAVASNNLAWMMAEQGENLDTALRLAQAAMRADPDSARINHTIG